MTIWKFKLEVTDRQIVEMPKGATILKVGNLDKPATLYLWALCDLMVRHEERIFEIFGTGHDIPEVTQGERKFIGTIITVPFVWHVFERIANK